MQFSRIPPGLVRLTDARRGTERHVALISFWLSTVTVSTTDLTARRITETTPGDCSLPAAGVMWREAVTWCNSASEHEGLQPAYLIGGDTVQWNPRAEGYRLPTEAEWVHGSLGGSTGPRHGPLDQIAWTEEDGTTGPQPSAGKDANAYGLFDTLGNVWEWCWDRLDPARYGDYRVLKGGGWADPRWSCRVGVRRGNAPDAIVDDVGFRVARGAVSLSKIADCGQGWSEHADRQRAKLDGPLPVGWTPLK